jgi:hypothetical protein
MFATGGVLQKRFLKIGTTESEKDTISVQRIERKTGALVTFSPIECGHWTTGWPKFR